MNNLEFSISAGIPMAVPRDGPASESAIDDEQIVTRVCDGDKEAFGILVKKYENFVYTLVRGLVMSNEPARDITQETFIRAYRAIRRFERKATLKTWLYRIGYNTALNYIKKYGTTEVPLVDHEFATSVTETEISTKMLVRRLVESLKPEHRAIIILHYYDDLKYEEIAEALDCPIGTVKVRLYRAKIELRQLWERYAR